MSAAAPGESKDVLGRAIRGVATNRSVVVGVAAAAAAVATTGVAVLLLSLIPSRTLTIALGIRNFPEEELDTSARGARSFLSPWLSQASGESQGFTFTYTSLAPLATLVLAAVLIGIGLIVRRATVDTLRARTTALIACALASGFLLAMLALALGFEIESRNFAATYTFSGGAYFFAAVAEVLLVGAFSFGVVGRWREPFRGAARTATIAFGSVFVLGTILFPFWLVAHNPPGPIEPQRSRDLAVSTTWAPGMASAALPLAVGAEVHLETEQFFSPFRYSTREDNYVYVPGLARYTEAHSSAHLGGYAGAGRIGWKLFVILGGVFLIFLWVAAAVRLVRSLGALRAVDGLRLGTLLGLFAVPLVVVVNALAAARLETEFPGGGQAVFWGVPGSATLQTSVELVVLTALVGAVYAALRPAPPQYVFPPLVVPSWLWPAPRTADGELTAASSAPGTPSATTARPRFCERCGAQFETPDADFCGRCGARRAGQRAERTATDKPG